jgi:hypothetical protein
VQSTCRAEREDMGAFSSREGNRKKAMEKEIGERAISVTSFSVMLCLG